MDKRANSHARVNVVNEEPQFFTVSRARANKPVWRSRLCFFARGNCINHPSCLWRKFLIWLIPTTLSLSLTDARALRSSRAEIALVAYFNATSITIHLCHTRWLETFSLDLLDSVYNHARVIYARDNYSSRSIYKFLNTVEKLKYCTLRTLDIVYIFEYNSPHT